MFHSFKRFVNAANVVVLQRAIMFNFHRLLCNFPTVLHLPCFVSLHSLGYDLHLHPSDMQKPKLMFSDRRPLTIDELHANHFMVSVQKYGFFLCREGTARILLGSNTYEIARNYLCIYPPNTFFQILERTANLSGILEEDDVRAYHPVLSSVDIRKRLQVRNSPCVKLNEKEACEIVRLYKMVEETSKAPQNDGVPEANRHFTQMVRQNCQRYLRYALCLKVVEAYFSHTPLEAMPQTKESQVLNRFLVSVYDNCHRQRTVQFYADEQHLSPYYFSSIIRAESGQSALQWIANVTMTFARQYLECSDMSVKEIADHMGFPDQSTFGRYFKHYEGCSPTEFREKMTKTNRI